MGKIKVNEIEKHDASEITVNSTVKIDTIAEKTSAAGVTIDSVLLKDGNVDGVDVSALNTTVSSITQGITEYDQWQLVNSTSANTNGDLSGAWSRFDQLGATYIGTGMSVSSGIFTFPSTGKWEVILTARIANTGNDDQLNIDTMFTTNNSSYSSIMVVGEGGDSAGRGTATSIVLLDITDTSQCKIKFTVQSASSNTYVFGNSVPSDTSTGKPQTYAQFKRIGDT